MGGLSAVGCEAQDRKCLGSSCRPGYRKQALFSRQMLVRDCIWALEV